MDLREKISIIQNLIATNKFSQAISNCKKILKKNPHNSFVHNLCGLAYQGNKEILKSVESFNKALLYEPDNLAALNNIANSYKYLMEFDKSEEIYKTIIKKDPKNIKALNNYANLKLYFNDYESAKTLLEKALKVDDKEINILFSLASSFISTGDFDDAKRYIYKILSILPHHIPSHKLLSTILNYKNDFSHLKDMEKILSHKDFEKVPPENKVNLYFALGKAYEDLKEYDKSFDFLEKANSIFKNLIKYNFNEDEKIFNNIIKAFNEINFNKFKKKIPNKQIIFICGMPRSGTTLLEQIISAHKKVTGAGELPYIQSIIKDNFINNLIINKQKIIDESINEENFVAEKYLSYLEFYNYETNIIIDKAPQNFMWIGFVKIFFPNCKIIHCTRNAKDVCLSIYKNQFPSDEMRWSYSDLDIAKYYKLYFKIMKFWKLKLDEFIYDVNYEKIVENPEEEAKKVIKFCGLEWDPNCIDFNKNKKTPIKTVSATQARKSIYRSSINSNESYNKYLKEMFNFLDT